jgi:hypothetical protein
MKDLTGSCAAVSVSDFLLQISNPAASAPAPAAAIGATLVPLFPYASGLAGRLNSLGGTSKWPTGRR